MFRSKKTIYSCLVIFIAAFFTMFMLSWAVFSGKRSGNPIALDRGLRNKGSLNYYKLSENNDYYGITYGFIDFTGKKQRVSFDISKVSHRELSDKFGYNQQETEKRVIERLKGQIDRIIRESGFSSYIKYTITARRINIDPVSVPSGIYSEVKRTMKAICDYYSSNFIIVFGEEIKDRGFYLDGDLIKIDYKKLSLWNLPHLKGCFNALYKAGNGYSRQKYLGLFVSFLQEIDYRIPPAIVDSKVTGGIYIPTDVLINNRGDCDSKSILFCSLWQNFSESSIIIIETHEHALIGVEAVPQPGQSFVRIGNRYYVLCEVAGPGKNYPGYSNSIKGTYKYYLIK